MENLMKIAQSIFQQYIQRNGYQLELHNLKLFKAIRQDLDNDGEEEVCFVAGIPDVWDMAVCCLVDLENERERVIEIVPIADGFRDLQIWDINNDGIPEIISLWQAGSGAYLSLYIFQWDGTTLTSLFPEMLFHQGFMELKDLDADNVDEITIWKGNWSEEFQDDAELDASSDFDFSDDEHIETKELIEELQEVQLEADFSEDEEIDLEQLAEEVQEVEGAQWSAHYFDIYVFRYQNNAYQLQTIHRSDRRYAPSSIVSREISFMGTPPDAEHRFSSVREYQEKLEKLIKKQQVNDDFVTDITRHQSVLWQEGFYEEAISIADLAIEATKYLPDSPNKMCLLVLLWREKGVTLSFVGDYPQAIECYARAIVSWTEEISAYFPGYYRAGLQRELGAMYSTVGDYEHALSSFSTARTILELLDLSAIENIEERSRLYSNFGLTYARLGEPDLASSAFEQAIILDRELGNNFGLVINYMGLGNVQRNIQKYGEAIESYQTALAAMDEVSDRDRESDVYLEIGSTLILTHQLEEGLQYLHKALLLTSVGNLKHHEAIHYLHLGEAYRQLNDLHLADRFFHKALSFARDFETQETQWQALYGLALTYQHQGLQTKCHQALEEAIEAIEQLRLQYLPETLKISLFARKTKPYEAMVFLHRTTSADRSFNYMERVKSRVFIEQLATTNIGSAGISSELADREVQLIGQLRQLQLRHRETLNQQKYEWGDEISQVETKLDRLWHDIGRSGDKGTEYITLRQAKPLDFSEVKQILQGG